MHTQEDAGDVDNVDQVDHVDLAGGKKRPYKKPRHVCFTEKRRGRMYECCCCCCCGFRQKKQFQKKSGKHGFSQLLCPLSSGKLKAARGIFWSRCCRLRSALQCQSSVRFRLSSFSACSAWAFFAARPRPLTKHMRHLLFTGQGADRKSANVNSYRGGFP